MSKVKPFSGNSTWLNKVDYNNNIDYFFTQRKIVETSEYIDDKTLERKEKKETVTHNFLAINFPTVKDNFSNIKIEIWGDNGFNYNGELITSKGNIPNLMLKLNDDSEIFVKLIYYNSNNIDNNNEKTYIHFIPVIKRYQKKLI